MGHLNSTDMNAEQFNEKYRDFLKDGYYGLALDNPEAIVYLDEKFQEFIKRSDFKYSQIKSKFNWFCFYADGITAEEQRDVENRLEELYAA